MLCELQLRSRSGCLREIGALDPDLLKCLALVSQQEFVLDDEGLREDRQAEIPHISARGPP